METLRKQPAPTVSAEETSARLEAILDTAVDAIITIGDRGCIESFNRAAEGMFGYRAHEAIGRNISMLMPESHASRHDQYMRDDGMAKQRVIGRSREISAIRRDGQEFPIELALSAVEVDGRRIYTGIIRDISRSRAANIELRQHREHLEQMVAKRTSALEASNQRLEDTQKELRQANEKLEQLVRIDELTGIGNRRAFDEWLELEWRRHQRFGKPLSLIICDVDHFKRYNDHYGHPAGDNCLRQIGATFSKCFQRAAEFAARYGGEEFAAILTNTDAHTAKERAETLRKKIRALEIEHHGIGPDQYVTASMGVASLVPARSAIPLQLVEAADAALYRAKQSGRNCVEVASFDEVTSPCEIMT